MAVIRYYSDSPPDAATLAMIEAAGNTVEYVDRNAGSGVSYPDSPYTSPGTSVPSYDGPLNSLAFDPVHASTLNDKTAAVWQAFYDGNVQQVHALLDEVNAMRRVTGMPDYQWTITDAEIVAKGREQASVAPNYTGKTGPIAGSYALPTVNTGDVYNPPPNSPPATAAPGSIPAATTGGYTLESNSGASPTAAAATPTSAGGLSTFDLIRQRAGLPDSATLGPDQWAYYWSDVTGAVPPAPESYGYSGNQRNAQVTLAQWWAAFTSGAEYPASAAPSGQSGASGAGVPYTGGGGGEPASGFQAPAAGAQSSIPKSVIVAGAALLLLLAMKG